MQDRRLQGTSLFDLVTEITSLMEKKGKNTNTAQVQLMHRPSTVKVSPKVDEVYSYGKIKMTCMKSECILSFSFICFYG